MGFDQSLMKIAIFIILAITFATSPASAQPDVNQNQDIKSTHIDSGFDTNIPNNLDLPTPNSAGSNPHRTLTTQILHAETTWLHKNDLDKGYDWEKYPSVITTDEIKSEAVRFASKHINQSELPEQIDSTSVTTTHSSYRASSLKLRGTTSRPGTPSLAYRECSNASAVTDWESIYKNSLHTSRVADCGPISDVDVSWNISLGSQNSFSTPPVVSDGEIYAIDNSGMVYAVGAANGTQFWKTEVPHHGGNAGLAVSGGYIITTTNTPGNATMVAIDANTGQQIWRTDLPWADGRYYTPDTRTYDPKVSAPVVSEGIAYATSADSRRAVNPTKVYSVWASNGTLRWDQRITTSDISFQAGTPSVGEETVFVGGQDLYALDAQTGEREWATTSNKSLSSISGSTLINNKVYTRNQGKVVELNASTGVVRQELSESVVSPAIGPNNEVIITASNNLTSHSLPSGQLEWKAPTGSPRAAPTVASNAVYLVDSSGLRAVDSSSGAEFWHLPNENIYEEESGPFSDPNAELSINPVLANGSLYILSDGGELYSIRGSSSYSISDVSDSVKINVSDRMAYDPQRVSLTATTTGNGLVRERYDKYRWDVNGKVWTGQETTVSFTDPGPQNVTLTVEAANGERFSISRTITHRSNRRFDPKVTGSVHWLHDGGSASHSGLVGRQNPPTLKSAWNYSIGSSHNDISVTSHAIYQRNGSEIYKYSKNGTRIWEYTIPDAYFDQESPANLATGPDGRLFFSSGSNLLSVASNGTMRWEVDGSNTESCSSNSELCLTDLSTPISSEGTIFVTGRQVGTDNIYLRGLSQSNGTIFWSKQFYDSYSGTIAPTADKAGNIYVTHPGAGLISFTSTGSERWSVSASGTATTYPVVSQNGRVLLNTERNLTAVSQENGSVLWTVDSLSEGAPAVGPDGTIFAPIDGYGRYGLRYLTGNGTETERVFWTGKEPEDYQFDQVIVGSQGYVLGRTGPDIMLATNSGEKVNTRSVSLRGDIAPLAPGYTVISGEDGMETFGGSVNEEPVLDANITHTPLVPKPEDSLTVSAVNSTGMGPLSYTWYRNGTELYCDSVECTISNSYTSIYPVEITLEVTQADGQTDTETIVVRSLSSEVKLDTKVGDQIVTGDSSVDLLTDDTLVVSLNESEIDHEITDISWESRGSVDITIDGSNVTVTPQSAGEATVTAVVTLRNRIGNITTRAQTVNIYTHRFHKEYFSQFEFDYENPPEYRWRHDIASLQSKLPAIYRNLSQRTTGLSTNIEFTFVPRSSISEYCGEPNVAGCAKEPNKVFIPYRNTWSRGYDRILHHELTHISQFETDAEIDGQWEFFLEGHASYEESPRFWDTTVDKPSKSELLEFDNSDTEYDEAANFVTAFVAEYGRQDLLEMVRKSGTHSFEAAFSDVTGDSFSDFYEQWEPHDEENGPNAIRLPANGENIIFKPMFSYGNGQLVTVGPRLGTLPERVGVSWDIDNDGSFEKRGECVTWDPDKKGTHTIQLRYETDSGALTNAQTFNINNITAGSRDCGTKHESGVTQSMFDAVANDGNLQRTDILSLVQSYIAGDQIHGVAPDRTDVVSLVEYYIITES